MTVETWLLQQVSTAASLDGYAPSIKASLESFDVAGFSVRVPWSAIAADLSLLDRARAITPGRLCVRFMAGRYTPPALMGRSFVYDGADSNGSGKGAVAPVTFNADGSDNKVFLNAWKAKVTDLVAWSRANGVEILHLPWPGLLWAELALVSQQMALPGYTLLQVQNYHVAMERFAIQAAAPDLTVEFPLSGYAPLALRTPIVALAKATTSPKNVVLSANNFDGTTKGIPQGDTIRRALQMFDGKDYDWAQAFTSAETVKAEYLEVYLSSFLGANREALRAQIAAHGKGEKVAALRAQLEAVEADAKVAADGAAAQTATAEAEAAQAASLRQQAQAHEDAATVARLAAQTLATEAAASYAEADQIRAQIVALGGTP